MKRSATTLSLFGKAGRWTALLVAIGFITGCVYYQAPVVPPLGGVYTSLKAPLTPNFQKNPTGSGTAKVSQKFTHYFYEPLITHSSFAWDDVAIAKIAREGGIKEVSYADYEILNVLGIYQRFTVHVYGN